MTGAVACEFVAVEPRGVRSGVDLRFVVDGTVSGFEVVIRHALTGVTVRRDRMKGSGRVVRLAVDRPRLEYLSDYWRIVDDRIPDAIIPPEFHFEVLVFPGQVPEHLPPVGSTESVGSFLSLEVGDGGRSFDPRNSRPHPWNPRGTPGVNPWPIP